MYEENIIQINQPANVEALKTAILSGINSAFPQSVLDTENNTVWFDENETSGIRAVVSGNYVQISATVNSGVFTTPTSNLMYNAAYFYQVRWRKSKTNVCWYFAFYYASGGTYSEIQWYAFVQQKTLIYHFSGYSTRIYEGTGSAVNETVKAYNADYQNVVLTKAINPFSMVDLPDIYNVSYGNHRYSPGSLVQNGTNIYAMLPASTSNDIAMLL